MHTLARLKVCETDLLSAGGLGPLRHFLQTENRGSSQLKPGWDNNEQSSNHRHLISGIIETFSSHFSLGQTAAGTECAAFHSEKQQSRTDLGDNILNNKGTFKLCVHLKQILMAKVNNFRILKGRAELKVFLFQFHRLLVNVRDI